MSTMYGMMREAMEWMATVCGDSVAVEFHVRVEKLVGGKVVDVFDSKGVEPREGERGNG